MKAIRRISIAFALSPVLIIVLIIGVLSGGSFTITNNSIDKPATLSALVESYRETVQVIAKEQGMEEYIDLILAIMQVESGGAGNDPMQSSESQFNKKYPRKPNAIMDPYYSIEVGIIELKDCIGKADVQSKTDIEHITIALSSYNFGTGFIGWLEKNYDRKWSLEATTEYSIMMAKKLGWSAYGDPPYATKVLNYYNQYSFITGKGDFIIPMKNYSITSYYGTRGLDGFHYGLDLSGGYGAMIYSPIEAKIHRVSKKCEPNGGYYGNTCPANDFASGGGNYIQLEVQYEGVTLYISLFHMAEIFVSEGQTVSKGQSIGTQGHSGNSTGSHLHIEVHQGTDRGIGTMVGIMDPIKLFKEKENKNE